MEWPGFASTVVSHIAQSFNAHSIEPICLPLDRNESPLSQISEWLINSVWFSQITYDFISLSLISLHSIALHTASICVILSPFRLTCFPCHSIQMHVILFIFSCSRVLIVPCCRHYRFDFQHLTDRIALTEFLNIQQSSSGSCLLLLLSRVIHISPDPVFK